MSLPRRPPGTPGGLPQTEKREQYLRLMAQGMNNSEACRILGVGRGTGIYWRYGRTVQNPDGSARTYAPIMASVQISERFLSEDERLSIADSYAAGSSIRGIAAQLGRSPSTISREIRRNSDPVTGKYHPFRAQKRARERRGRPKAGKLATDELLRAFVQQCLRERWSPQQISNTLPILFAGHPGMRICHETIYQALYQSEHVLTRASPKMGRHHEFSTATSVPVYFCRPGSPWQRGTNENINGLLRQYFPKGTDIGTYDKRISPRSHNSSTTDLADASAGPPRPKASLSSTRPHADQVRYDDS